jgi:tetratricopeptide (TPR) repeat protein
MPEAEAEPVAVTIDPNSSFADLNEDLNGAPPAGWSSAAVSAKPIPFAAAELGGGSSFEDAGLAPEKGSGEGRVKLLLAQELESVDYYLAQGYTDIARDTLDMLERQYGANEEISQRRRQMPQDADALVTFPNAPAAASNEFTPAEFESFAPMEEAAEEVEIEDHLFISATPVEETAPVVDAKPAPPAPPSQLPSQPTPQETPQVLHNELADMFEEFRDEDEANDPASTADYETHYNTALAYREMGLIDQAVEELQAAIALAAPLDGTPRYLQCCNLLGHCFMQKDMPRPAAMWFKKGLDAPGHTEDEYQALRYELGAAYEAMGDLERAIEVFSEVYGTDVNYRGVAAKLRDLQAKKVVTSDK